ncbi:hypothetical protein ACSBR2_010021 [Camellia fascicularis]
MCFKVECKKCGKYSWGGCGNHLTTLYGSIEEGKHCLCSSWPGVVIPPKMPTPQPPSPSSSSLTAEKMKS